MFAELPTDSKFFYHNMLSIIMVFIWIYFGYKGYKLRNTKALQSLSKWIIVFCLVQEILDFSNRIFLDPSYTFSIQRDLPFLQFCQVSFYFSLACIYLSRYNKNKLNQFLFDCSFLLGLSGAFQAIITPEFSDLNINNFIGVVCIQLQHSLIILNIIWLMCGYNYRLTFRGLCYTYLFINIIAPIALLINFILGTNSNGEIANYFYVNQLPPVDNFFLNFVSQYPSPDYILYIQPVFIIYFLILYLPFLVINKFK